LSLAHTNSVSVAAACEMGSSVAAPSAIAANILLVDERVYMLLAPLP
jgi:hypothetical protein